VESLTKLFCLGTPIFRQAQYQFTLTRKKVEHITDSACFSFIKFGVCAFFASYAGKFLILNIENF
tara:strand:+ start:8647 stop:8841 length:195 start_codon:yes stop_codon:yes gene_type:complete